MDEIWHLWPLKIGGVGDKHPHDSDHAECVNKLRRIYRLHDDVGIMTDRDGNGSSLVTHDPCDP